MLELSFDCIVIGAGAAGMASSLEVAKSGYSVAIIDREERAGGILLQCIHNGFGLHEFKEELTGPEYAERFFNRVKDSSIKLFLNTTVIDIKNEDSYKIVIALSKNYGVLKFITKTVVLAMGCRERNRGNIGIPGTRCSGIFTAGLAQRLINIEGYIPGKDVVILGSGDIGLIMARRLTFSKCNVKCVVEIQKYPSGLTRNIVQCLNDFNIPLYLSHTISKIYGKDRIEKVDITPLKEGKLDYSKTFSIECDTLLLSVGLIPENELSKKVDITINPQYNGPYVDSTMMTNIKGIFACGNVLHVHDLVDYVTEESRRTGEFVVNYLKNIRPEKEILVKTGANIRYVVPQKLNPHGFNKFYFRSLINKNNVKIKIDIDNNIIKIINKPHVQPSEMISVEIDKSLLNNITIKDDSVLTFSIETE